MASTKPNESLKLGIGICSHLLCNISSKSRKEFCPDAISHISNGELRDRQSLNSVRHSFSECKNNTHNDEMTNNCRIGKYRNILT